MAISASSPNVILFFPEWLFRSWKVDRSNLHWTWYRLNVANTISSFILVKIPLIRYCRMDEQLRMAAENGDVDALYIELAQDPYLLDRIDHIPIVDTPLHVAANAGKHHFAMEVANLKPSLAWKLNHVGLSPMHLALQHKCTKMVRGLITINSQLIRVKAKGMITPLHYLAQTEDPDLLAELLSACPSSIEDTTIHCETAAHMFQSPSGMASTSQQRRHSELER
ncbi:ankyrin repeat-containing protein [Gossypium australe]|uniref:Ankyrin repeat-containing protein n=1 Tax=Gossypium australe TaxID=47621 RepID=A0A5B6UTK6_9ROSI|nr:ankyrin repeat-containing protein [Gossypium australe]